MCGPEPKKSCGFVGCDVDHDKHVEVIDVTDDDDDIDWMETLGEYPF